MAICNPTEHWSSCAQKTKNAIRESKDAAQALNATNDWAVKYKSMYLMNPTGNWSKDDQERIEEYIEGQLEDYANPANIALDIALRRYLPTLAALLGLLSSAYAQAFYILLAPSPIANDFTQATQVNKEINELLHLKLQNLLFLNWQQRYDNVFDNSYFRIKGHPFPKP